MRSSTTLEDHLAAALPVGVSIRAYHLSTPPTATSAIFSAPPGQPEEKTFCEHHFLSISAPEAEGREELFVFAIEVLIFTTRHLTTIFVSKADSSGFVSSLNVARGSPSVVQAVTVAFLDFLLKPRLCEQRIVLSLFARSQNQYLFPGSIDNKEKHVLDDRQLIKWWCRILDSIWRPHTIISGANDQTTVTAHVVVPGCDTTETKAFFPVSARSDDPRSPKWIASYPVDLLHDDTKLPPRCLIPRLPDDPKARFLDDLDGDKVANDGQWRSIKTLDQFWEMMSYRQECSAGRLVGFVWVTFSNGVPSRNETSITDELLPRSQLSQVTESTETTTIASLNSHEPIADVYPRSVIAISGVNKTVRSQDEQALSPKEAAIDSVGQDLFFDDECLLPVPWPINTKGHALLSVQDYQILMDCLLEQDFEGTNEAANSTRAWIEQLLMLSKHRQAGVAVSGHRPTSIASTTTMPATPTINTLTGFRKKRKPVETGPETTSAGDKLNDLTTDPAQKKKRLNLSHV